MRVKGHHVRVITDDLVYVEDTPGNFSITFDVDDFIAKLHLAIGTGRRIFYKDLSGAVDELVVDDDGRFSYFRSCPSNIEREIYQLLRGAL